MIGKRQWYAAPDDTIETWCFLTLKTEEREQRERIVRWQVGFGNPTRITRTESEEMEAIDDGELLVRGLLDELASHRYDGVLLIVPRRRTIRLLRTRLLSLEDRDHVTLRGFSILVLSELVDRYFEFGIPISRTWSAEPESLLEEGHFDDSPDELRELLNRIGPLVPRRSLAGDPL